MKTGIVKWFRTDGTGYIVDIKDETKKFLVHYSAIQSKSEIRSLKKGQKVNFRSTLILGREVAVYVEPI